jgi:hypothetical protein
VGEFFSFVALACTSWCSLPHVTSIQYISSVGAQYSKLFRAAVAMPLGSAVYSRYTCVWVLPAVSYADAALAFLNCAVGMKVAVSTRVLFPWCNTLIFLLFERTCACPCCDVTSLSC